MFGHTGQPTRAGTLAAFMLALCLLGTPPTAHAYLADRSDQLADQQPLVFDISGGGNTRAAS